MRVQGVHHQNHHITSTKPTPVFPITLYNCSKTHILNRVNHKQTQTQRLRICGIPATLGSISSKRFPSISTAAAAQPSQPLDLTEDNIRQVLADARDEFGHLFDTSVGMTGQVDLADLDGPFVKISLKGRFWHERSLVLARLANYLKKRIPEILEVDIEDEKQLDDSPANF
ncbi:PREDICTED: uncharacterized protein LOC101312268 [Fragaria vesca subsp. vesca]|uniref:uncharacterized protein LOC101312268 n=1 Tax=Fragaria vesca subsp. vesca TaxID=101020 RepID=UPI0002C2DE95|nr:PREDICTED: uncharacterized protein LOC101312268 [Fragaria vesca subsp. vesca]XP_011467246.1 PREDICTED: uncharacterized protein LOC101312268 [Fragaria vesca subsp. vesca]